MKQRRMEQICFEKGLKEFNLLIDFIKRISERKEVTYQFYELDISEDKFKEWIKRFKSGNPIKEMNQTEKKKFISVIISRLDD